jgi:hypothetical protein
MGASKKTPRRCGQHPEARPTETERNCGQHRSPLRQPRARLRLLWWLHHYVGHLVEGEDGEEVEVFAAVPCRRCLENSR